MCSFSYRKSYLTFAVRTSQLQNAISAIQRAERSQVSSTVTSQRPPTRLLMKFFKFESAVIAIIGFPLITKALILYFVILNGMQDYVWNGHFFFPISTSVSLATSFQLAERVHMEKYCVSCASQFNINSTVTYAFSASDERDLTSINLLQSRRNLAMF